MEADCEAAVERWKDHARKAGGVIETTHSTDVESPPLPPRVCMSTRPTLNLSSSSSSSSSSSG